MVKTKTFIENRWYIRLGPHQFQELSREETGEGLSLDAQISDWVDATGNILVHPGQLGMHTAWHGDKEDPLKLKCITLGLTVLYQEPLNEQRNTAIIPATAVIRERR